MVGLRRLRAVAVLGGLALGCYAPSAGLGQQGPAGTIAYTGPAALGETGIWLIQPDGSGARPVPDNVLKAALPAWSRDGRLIAATGAPYGDPSRQEVFLFDVAQEQWRQVTHLNERAAATTPATTHFLSFKAFSPTADRLAVADSAVWGGSRPGSETALLVTSLDGSSLTIVALRTGSGVDWSPATGLLIVPSLAIDGSSGEPWPVTALFVVPPVAHAFDRGLSRQVSLPRYVPGFVVEDRVPAFSPDGQRVAFMRRETPVLPGGPCTSSIRVINLDGSDDREVIRLPAGQVANSVGWSGDGTTLLFDEGPELASFAPCSFVPDLARTRLWVIRADGTDLSPISAPPSSYPSWSWAR
jgi:hypothetical protein